ncbi:GHKL domain-containing protein [Candidatus Obscuribacterales bacterium]|nr:GHKL domain-containing protein [Candidatus Obscuribacterales bacterium]
MVDSIRIKLALWFVCMVMLLYSVDSIASLMVFKISLMRSVDVGLEDLIAEIEPSVKTINGKPSLEEWHEEAKGKHPILATVQIYDVKGKPIEEYGPEGVPQLHNGHLRVRTDDRSLRSMFSKIEQDGKTTGYIQLQVSTKPQDDAIEQFFLVVMVVAPFIAAGVGICAYLFSGQAVKPIERTLLMLRRFVADAGHELNTPVATIEACLETLKDPHKLGDMSDDVFRMMERASDRLRHLSKDLIVLARIEDPESEMMRSNVPVKELAESVIAELGTIARERKIELVVQPIPDVMMYGHHESILEIFNNLIENAIKYSEEGGKVRIDVEQKDANLHITVADNGVGIPADSINNIFDRFYRVDKSRSRDVGGSGLGLSIVKAAVERHSGNVTVESEPGKGTTFRVTLPLARVGT